jgi:O-antigen ligase
MTRTRQSPSDRYIDNGGASLRLSNRSAAAETSTIVLAYVVFWNIDFSIVFGSIGGQAVAVGRWIAILGVIFLVMRDLAAGRDFESLLPIAVLMSLFWPSILFSNDQFYSVVEFVRILSLFFIYWLLCERPLLARGISIAVGVFAICALIGSLPYLSAFAKLSFFGGAGDAAGRFRDVGITTHANNFGFISNLALSYTLSQSLSVRRRSPLLFRVFVAVIGVLSLLLSDSRTAQIELVAIFALFTYFRFFRSAVPLSRGKAAAQRVLIAFGVLALISLPALIVIGDVNTSSLVSNDSFGESNAARLSIWRTAWSEFLDHPLTGVGLGGQILERYNPIENIYIYAPYAHNGILNILYVAGLGGAMWFVALIRKISYILLSALGARREALVRNVDNSELFFFTAIVTMTIISAVVEGGLQNNYGLNSFLAISLGTLAAMSKGRRMRVQGVLDRGQMRGR